MFTSAVELTYKKRFAYNIHAQCLRVKQKDYARRWTAIPK